MIKSGRFLFNHVSNMQVNDIALWYRKFTTNRLLSLDIKRMVDTCIDTVDNYSAS